MREGRETIGDYAFFHGQVCKYTSLLLALIVSTIELILKHVTKSGAHELLKVAKELVMGCAI